MNDKQAKSIRRALREGGVDWRERKYSADKAGTVGLTFECGRAKYRRFKRFVLSP